MSLKSSGAVVFPTSERSCKKNSAKDLLRVKKALGKGTLVVEGVVMPNRFFDGLFQLLVFPTRRDTVTSLNDFYSPILTGTRNLF